MCVRVRVHVYAPAYMCIGGPKGAVERGAIRGRVTLGGGEKKGQKEGRTEVRK